MDTTKPFLIYLRKSRKDRDLELQTGITDTLQRHRDQLLDLAKTRGYMIAEILEEVVTGDTIAERPKMQQLLSMVETGLYEGVLVIEVPRLARGNTKDQGIVAETFQYSNTKIVTPEKIYDPSNDEDEEYFEFGLFMARREYKTINRRLQRGRMVSFREGKYIAGVAPYGYKKVKLHGQKGYTLEIDPEKAAVVREIFQLYTVGEPTADGIVKPLGSQIIANELNARGTLSPGGKSWTPSAVRDILKNPVYAGFVRWAYRPEKKQMSGGAVVTVRSVNQTAPVQKGVHDPIIREEVFTAAQSAMKARVHASVPTRCNLSNPIAGICRCSECGYKMVQLPQGPNRPPLLRCPTNGCKTKGSRLDVVESALLDSMRSWLNAYKVDLTLAAPAEDTHAEAIRAAEQVYAKIEKELAKLSIQRDSLFDLLEQGIYSKEVFLERSQNIATRIDEATAQLTKAADRVEQLRQSYVTKSEIIPRFENVLDLYPTLTDAEKKNSLLKTVLDSVVYSKSTGGRYEKSDMKLYIFPKIKP